MLGIELKYRGGFTFYDAEPGVSVSNVVERHQWLELTYRPSMETCTCDLWIEDADGPQKELNPAQLTCPISEAYSHWMYPNGELLLGTIVPPLEDDELE